MRSHWLILTGAGMLAGTLAMSGGTRDVPRDEAGNRLGMGMHATF